MHQAPTLLLGSVSFGSRRRHADLLAILRLALQRCRLHARIEAITAALSDLNVNPFLFQIELSLRRRSPYRRIALLLRDPEASAGTAVLGTMLCLRTDRGNSDETPPVCCADRAFCSCGLLQQLSFQHLWNLALWDSAPTRSMPSDNGGGPGPGDVPTNPSSNGGGGA